MFNILTFIYIIAVIANITLHLSVIQHHTHLAGHTVSAARGLKLPDVLPDHVVTTITQNLLGSVITPNNLRKNISNKNPV